MPLFKTETKFFKELRMQQNKKTSISLSKLSMKAYRAQVAFLFSQFSGAAFQCSYKNIVINSRDGYSIPVRFFNYQLPINTPTLIFFPGCGYTVDLFEANAIAISRLANYLDIKILLVNYRLVPEYLLPTSIQDGFDVTIALWKNASLYNVDHNNFYVGGLSSGAHCATVIAIRLLYENLNCLKGQILISGIYDLTFSLNDYHCLEIKDKLLTQEAKQYIKKYLLPSFSKLPCYQLSPLQATNITNLLSTALFVAEFDGLRSDTEAYFKYLLKNGVKVSKIIFEGQTHNTILLRKALSEGVDPYEVVANFLIKNYHFLPRNDYS